MLWLFGVVGGSSGDTSSTDTTTTEETTSSESSGCCVCEMQGDRVKCQRHGGAWFNPPAGEGGSNDQSVELSLEECNKGCGTNASSPTDRERDEQKGVNCPSGYNSVNGKCVKITQASSGTGKASGQNSNTARRTTSTPKSSVTGSGQPIKPKAGTSTARYFNANPRGYKPGGGTYYTYRSFFVDPTDPRPFTLYHRIAN